MASLMSTNRIQTIVFVSLVGVIGEDLKKNRNYISGQVITWFIFMSKCLGLQENTIPDYSSGKGNIWFRSISFRVIFTVAAVEY